RGFYFTSGTQQCAPIDQLINALIKNFGAQEISGAVYSGPGKSFFLYNLIQKVIIGEAAWVSTDIKVVRRALLLKAGAIVGICAATTALGGAWLTSYSRNRQLVADVDAAAKEYAASPGYAIVRDEVVSDRDFSRILPLLEKLRDAPTSGAGGVRAGFAEGLGLSQRERLMSASESAYRLGLERLLRPRLLYRLEEVLDSRRDEPDYIYEALKVYMMLGGLHSVDRDLVLSWERQDWQDELYQGAGPQAAGRKALEEHLTAMLDLEGNGEMLSEPSMTVVEESQKTLARLSVSERAHQLLKSQARLLHIPDWVATRAGGADLDRVFEGAGGAGLDSIHVPAFFTYSGFQQAFLGNLPGIAERVAKERWVLGKFADQNVISDQYKTLPQDLLDFYTKDFAGAWRDALEKLRVKRLTADKPRYLALAAAASAASPIKTLFESISDETTLTKEHRGKEGAGDSRQQKEGAQPTPAPASLFPDQDQAPGAKIEAQFQPYHEWVEGNSTHRPIDELVAELSEIKDNLITSATVPSDAPQANALLAPLVQKFKANASRLPDPFKNMLLGAAAAFEKDVNNSELGRLSKALGDQVLSQCQQVVPGRYPFARSASSEIALADFGRLFAPGGIIDGFFKGFLAKYADTSKREWTWRPEQPLSKSLSLATLKEFQRAAQIRDAFFPSGGNMPTVNLLVFPPVLSGVGVSAKLEVNGAVVATQAGTSVVPQAIQWPGAGGGRPCRGVVV
ncbi:MAG TPA: type VI secretion system membrane subunit TssM, partial [Methylocella sp.]|nr:type VI secretion system membrane subunit TssM [Methylocella sp.]